MLCCTEHNYYNQGITDSKEKRSCNFNNYCILVYLAKFKCDFNCY